tara:strand:- start:13699 stop:14322 length:624 start_codon:yes stop_codon:yes gene_type:complete
MINTSKGTEIANSMLLTQYENSPIFKQYLAAFVDEMDLLFEQIERVYLGRFIEVAEGRQLDIIGIILNEFRNVNIPTQFFGFSDNGTVPTNVAPLADSSTPFDGGVFRSTGQVGTSNLELSDKQYRQLLLAKAFLSTKDQCGVNDAYHALATLLGRVPRLITLTTIASRQVQLALSAEDTTLADVSLISYFSKYLAPLGTSFTITRI